MRIFFLVLFTVLTIPLTAHAACTGPGGAESQSRYDFGLNKMFFCDGDNWVEMGGGGGGGGTVLPLNCSTVTASVPATGTGWRNASVSCSAGTVVVGAGINCGDAQSRNNPTGNGWAGACYNSSGTLYARCCETATGAPATPETDPKIADTSSGKWCRGTGSQIVCDQNAPSASADNLGNHTATTNLAMGNNKITGLGAPTLNTDAATKKYVDDLIVISNCSGTVHDGGCWHMSDREGSCLETCINRGGYVNKTTSFNTFTKCATLLDAIGVPGTGPTVSGTAGTLPKLDGSCSAYINNATRQHRNGTFDPATHYNTNIACSCAR